MISDIDVFIRTEGRNYYYIIWPYFNTSKHFRDYSYIYNDSFNRLLLIYKYFSGVLCVWYALGKLTVDWLLNRLIVNLYPWLHLLADDKQRDEKNTIDPTVLMCAHSGNTRQARQPGNPKRIFRQTDKLTTLGRQNNLVRRQWVSNNKNRRRYIMLVSCQVWFANNTWLDLRLQTRSV